MINRHFEVSEDVNYKPSLERDGRSNLEVETGTLRGRQERSIQGLPMLPSTQYLALGLALGT